MAKNRVVLIQALAGKQDYAYTTIPKWFTGMAGHLFFNLESVFL